MAIVFLRDVVDKVANKFHAKGERVDGVWFSSRKEARRFAELQMLQRAGLIVGLARQVAFPLHVTTVPGARAPKVGDYVADFVYRPVNMETRIACDIVVEDAKGVRTELYRWKARHFALEYGLKILET